MKDQEILTRLFGEYRDKCYGFFIKLLNDQELAKDLTQDVFVNLIRRRDSLGEVEEWENYIYTACRNHAYNHLKKAAHHQKYQEYLSHYWSNSNNLLQPNQTEKRMEASHYEKLLEKGLEVLPDQQRIIFLLSKKEGLSHQKIAEKLEISPLTVRNHLHRALKTIRATTHPDVELVLLLCFLMF